MRKSSTLFAILFCLVSIGTTALSQETSTKPEKQYKNVVRYNLSNALLFGINRCVIFGYERVVGLHQSFSVNFGAAGLPKFVSVSTDSFHVSKDTKNYGYNFSVDYRFYLAKENKYSPPHGLYLGPYISYNHIKRDVTWNYASNSSQQVATSEATFNIGSIGGELGYQFVLWKRFAIDMVLIGPSISYYDLTANIQSNLSEAQKDLLRLAIEQLISQKWPGMNYVLSGKTFNSNGTLRTTSIGFRYLIHLGFVF
jgi:hypothetical protein